MAREIDDVYKRQKYKDERFDGKRSITDDYSGERIFYGNKREAIHTHNVSKTADIDHVTPVKIVDEHYSWLSTEQKKALANNEHNFAVVNGSINRSKGGQENHEYLLNQALKSSPESLKTSANMLAKEIDSRVVMDVMAAGMTMQNIADEATNIAESALAAAKDSISTVSTSIKPAADSFTVGAKKSLTENVIPLTTEAVNNLFQVASRKKTFEQAGKDLSKSVIEISIIGGAENLINTIAPDSCRQIVCVAEIVKDSAIKYINGEISGEAFIDEVGTKGMQMAVSLIAGSIGKEIGGIIGGTIGTALIPVTGTAVGIAAGEVVGQVLSSVVISASCAAIVAAKDAINTLKHMDDYKLKESKIRRLTDDALKEMERQRDIIKAIAKQEKDEWESSVNESFDLIISSLECNGSITESFDKVTKGLDNIMSLFGKSSYFHTADEYRAQLNRVLVI